LVTISGFSQEEELLTKKKTQFGIMGGFNQDFFTSSPYSFNGLNLFAGAFVEHRLSNKFRLQLEVLYKSTQGSGYNSLEFPVVLKYEISDRFRIYVGGQLNWSFRDNYVDPIYNQKPGNFALNLGLEYDLSEKWYVFARYIHNFKTFRVNGRDQQMRTFLLGVGYRF
jgi:hypothetical protein